MKKKSKLIIVIFAVCLLVMALTVTLVACGDKNNDSSVPDGPSGSGSTKPGGEGENTPCEHSYDEVEYREPLCDADGNIHYFKCNLCGKYFNENYEEIEESDTILAAKGHETQKVDRVDPTCSTTGNVDYWHCFKCNKNFPDQAGKQPEIEDVTLGKTEHTPGEQQIDEPASCTTPGRAHVDCTVCHDTIESDIVIPAKGHETYKVDRIEPTCLSTGNVEYWHCYNCYQNFPDENGEQPAIEDVNLPTKDHTRKLVVMNKPGCTHTGDGYYECTECHQTVERDVEIPATGHKTHKEEKVEATCEAGGYIECWQCDNCYKYFPDQEGKEEEIKSVSVPPLGHSYTGEYVYNDNQHWRKCERCGKEPPEYSSSDRYDHTLKEGEFLCECGCAYGYELTEDEDGGQYYKLKAYKGQTENAVVPDEINEIPVTFIDIDAFYNSSIKTVSIGKNVETINGWAFRRCKQLAEVVIPEGVRIMGGEVFYECTNLQSVTFPSTLEKVNERVFDGDTKLEKLVVSSLKSWCDLMNNSKCNIILRAETKLYIGENKVTEVTGLDGVESIYSNTFFGQDITSVTIPESLKSVDKMAFVECKLISKIIVPSVKAWCELENGEMIADGSIELYVGDAQLTALTAKDLEGVTEIGGYKFGGCTGLKSVEIPDGIIVSSNAFNGCTDLTTVMGKMEVVSQLLKNLTAVETVTITSWEEGSGTLSSSNVKTVTIGDGITQIGENAFYNCKQLTTVNIGKDVQSIGKDAFENCMQLAEIALPASLKTCDVGAFEGCKALTEVNFLGTVKEWLSIEFADNINHMHTSNPLVANDNVKLYFNGEELTSFSMEDVQGVTTFPLEAFRGCTQLTEISIPATVTEIKSGAFKGCTGLTKVNIESIKAWCGIKYESNIASNNPLYINYPNGYSYATTNKVTLYLNGETVKNITAADLEGVTNIPELAFASCTELTSVEIPKSVTKIGDAAFADCLMLTSVTVNGDPKCGSYVFIRSTKIQEATVPGSMTTYISKDSLLKITFTTGRVIGFSAFQNAPVLHTVIMKEDVTEVGDSVFFRCKKLKTLDLGKVQKIGNSAFAGCSALETLTINEGTTEIGYYAFQNCTGLRTLIIASSVQKIAQYAFQSCEDLSVYYLGDSNGWYAATNRDFTIFDQGTYNLYYYSAESNTDGQHWHWKDETTKNTPVVWGKEE